MERLRQCMDLPQRLERELTSLHTSTIGQRESQQVLVRLARSLGISTTVANLFVLSEPLTVPEYILFVRERVAEFVPVDIQAMLEQAEAGLNESPVPRSFGQMASELSQWQHNNDVVAARSVPASDEDGESDESDDDSESSNEEAPDSQRNDDDDESEVAEEPEKPPETALELCERLLQDPIQLSEFTRQLYDLVNVRGDSRVDLSQTQPFLDYLVNHNFEPNRLRVIISGLANHEFAQIRELNYVKFCVFVRYVLQRYGA